MPPYLTVNYLIHISNKIVVFILYPHERIVVAGQVFFNKRSVEFKLCVNISVAFQVLYGHTNLGILQFFHQISYLLDTLDNPYNNEADWLIYPK
jgi:hypothetical protein